MKLSENGKKKQKAILRTVALGLPVAGLLAAAGIKGCSSGRIRVSGSIRVEDPAENVVRTRTIGKIASPEPKGAEFSDIGER